MLAARLLCHIHKLVQDSLYLYIALCPVAFQECHKDLLGCCAVAPLVHAANQL